MDAALAACSVLAVVYPHMCTIGGDLFALLRSPDGRISAYNGSGAAARLVDVGRVRMAYGEMPTRGPDTVTVPGVLSAWDALASAGRLGLSAAVRAGVPYAEEGCPVSPSLARALQENEDVVAADQGLSSVFRGPESLVGEGGTFRQPALASTLRRIADRGVDDFYHGRIGEEFLEGLSRSGSCLSSVDLGAHETTISSPLTGKYRDWEIVTCPPNSQGYCLPLILSLLEALSLPPDVLGQGAGRIARVFRTVSADRDQVLSDPRTLVVAPEELLSPDRVASLAHDCGSGDQWATAAGGRPGGDTVAVVAADTEGWAVSVIQSVFFAFGSGILEEKTGILSHNRAACFTLDQDSPNCLAGGRRPLHTLMPVMVQKNGRLEVVAGTMGGRAQPQIHAQVLGHLLAGGLAVASALALPRWVVGRDARGTEAVVFAEPGALAACGQWLGDGGMEIETLKDDSDDVGHAQYIRIREGSFEAASDPRADGVAIVG